MARTTVSFDFENTFLQEYLDAAEWEYLQAKLARGLAQEQTPPKAQLGKKYAISKMRELVEAHRAEKRRIALAQSDTPIPEDSVI